MTQTKFGQYDGALQMYCEAPREPDMNKLGFLKYLTERGKMGPKTAVPIGDWSPK